MEVPKDILDQVLSQATAFWAHIVATYSPQKIEFVGTLLIQLFTFWLPSICYMLLDVIAPSFSQRHKIQPAPKQPNRREIAHCFLVVLQNQLLASALHITVLYAASHAGIKSTYRIEASLPAPVEILRDVFLSLLMREALFYYGHRILHIPALYIPIHKKHHRFTAPIALAAQFAHPIEHIFANTLPISLPPQFLGSHVLTFWLFLGYELVNTATVHSGYDFFCHKAKMHDLHHEKFNLNYGSLGLFDWVHGTDKLKKRHIA
ncbi:Fatty acid hydroxylase [Penicillium fimorum]|uniref:Fatty acid hydroxylase n=1 Tax=Penicillium fimorum TaxID=1882269 RepID=A0A9W9Y4F5_9EURO|nr:Fatty acid hydroxylase [Penicillium fimorum]